MVQTSGTWDDMKWAYKRHWEQDIVWSLSCQKMLDSFCVVHVLSLPTHKLAHMCAKTEWDAHGYYPYDGQWHATIWG